MSVALEKANGLAVGERALLMAQAVLSGSEAVVSRDLRRGGNTGDAATAILRASEERATDLIVVGSRGLSAMTRFFLGSVAERVARYAHCSVLATRPLRGDLGRVVLAVDGSSCSEYAATWLRNFPLPPQCEAHLVTMVAPAPTASSSHLLIPSLVERMRALVRRECEQAKEPLDSLKESFAAVGIRAVTKVRLQEVASGLLEVAEEQNADLIVVGSQGLTGIDRFLLGSVSEKALRYASCSVLVVRRCTGGTEADAPLQAQANKDEADKKSIK